MIRFLPYVTVRILSGGTYITGGSNDWLSQFAGATEFYWQITMAGELATSAITWGMCSLLAVFCNNEVNLPVFLEANTQLYTNPDLSSPVPTVEVTVAGLSTINLVAGWNSIYVIRASGPLVMIPTGGKVFDPSGIAGSWASPYAPGSDPFGISSGLDKPSDSTGGGGITPPPGP